MQQFPGLIGGYVRNQVSIDQGSFAQPSLARCVFDAEELQDELSRGARFVVFKYCFSLIVVTVSRESKIHFVRSDQSVFFRGLKYTMLTLLTGWWGFPWGPIFTAYCVFRNLFGGVDVTRLVAATTADSAEHARRATEFFSHIQDSQQPLNEAAPADEFLGDLERSGQVESPADFLRKLGSDS